MLNKINKYYSKRKYNLYDLTAGMLLSAGFIATSITTIVVGAVFAILSWINDDV